MNCFLVSYVWPTEDYIVRSNVFVDKKGQTRPVSVSMSTIATFHNMDRHALTHTSQISKDTNVRNILILKVKLLSIIFILRRQ